MTGNRLTRPAASPACRTGLGKTHDRLFDDVLVRPSVRPSVSRAVIRCNRVSGIEVRWDDGQSHPRFDSRLSESGGCRVDVKHPASDPGRTIPVFGRSRSVAVGAEVLFWARLHTTSLRRASQKDVFGQRLFWLPSARWVAGCTTAAVLSVLPRSSLELQQASSSCCAEARFGRGQPLTANSRCGRRRRGSQIETGRRDLRDSWS